MALIDPEGMFGGDRMAKLSDSARMAWPCFWCASNTVGRIELDYAKVIGRAFRQFQEKPSEETFWRWLGEFRQAFLLFIYEHEGQLWGQWETSEKFLARHKLAADMRTPTPLQSQWDEWRNQYIEQKKMSASRKVSAINNFAKPAKPCENLPTFSLGVGVGVGGGNGVGGGQAAPAKFSPDFPSQPSWENDETYVPFVEAWQQVAAVTGKPLIEDDFAEAHFRWKRLDFEQKLLAVKTTNDHLDLGLWTGATDPQYVPLPKKYLELEYKRPVVAPKSRDSPVRQPPPSTLQALIKQASGGKP